MAEVFDAIVMYQQDRKEKDLMVKMLTKQGGKRMFYIKNGKSKRYQFAADVQPLTVATFEGTLNQPVWVLLTPLKRAINHVN